MPHFHPTILLSHYMFTNSVYVKKSMLKCTNKKTMFLKPKNLLGKIYFEKLYEIVPTHI